MKITTEDFQFSEIQKFLIIWFGVYFGICFLALISATLLM